MLHNNYWSYLLKKNLIDLLNELSTNYQHGTGCETLSVHKGVINLMHFLIKKMYVMNSPTFYMDVVCCMDEYACIYIC